jgi:SAM-dependent methyltransferase
MPDAPEPSIHSAAADGFEAGAATYASGRPDYPAGVSRWLAATIGLRPGAVALDLGSGTGKFLPTLFGTGARVIAVEPVAAMRAELARAFPEVEARAGTAEAIPVGDGELDAIVCAQSFHWFSTRAALAEMRRALGPGGRLGLIWNVRDESVGWVGALTDIISPFEGDAPRFGGGRWRDVFPAEGFTPLDEARFPNAHSGPPERVIVEHTLSTSFVAALPEPKRREIAAEIRALIASTPDLAGRATVSYPYVTFAYSCRKL